MNVLSMSTTLPLTKILIHGCYGCYGLFSEEFEKEFEKEYNIDFDSLPSYQPFHDKKNQNEDIESRCDPRMIHIFEKLGSERSEKRDLNNLKFNKKSSLKIVIIPTELIHDFYISEYDGAEWVWCNISKKYKELFLEILEKNEILSNISHKLYIIHKCEKYLNENNIHFV